MSSLFGNVSHGIETFDVCTNGKPGKNTSETQSSCFHLLDPTKHCVRAIEKLQLHRNLKKRVETKMFRR